MEKVSKIWGYEEIIVNNKLYCLKFLHLHKGCYCSVHFHKKKDETFYILTGVVKMEIQLQNPNPGLPYPFEARVMAEGDSVRLTPGTKHRFSGVEDSVIVEVSTQDFKSDSYRLQESGCD
jgi:quercetin dioxygenase-like cupin family protein